MRFCYEQLFYVILSYSGVHFYHDQCAFFFSNAMLGLALYQVVVQKNGEKIRPVKSCTRGVTPQA